MASKKGLSKFELIKEDLNNQLSSLGKFGKYYEDLIDDYVFMVRQKDKLRADINKKGIRYQTTNGNGIEVSKYNESYTTFMKLNSQMLTILEKLNLKEPQLPPGPEEHEEDLC